MGANYGSHFHGAPGERTFSRVKVPNPPVSGKDIAKGKGASGDGGSEGSRRQNSGLTNRNHIEAVHGGKAAVQVKAQ